MLVNVLFCMCDAIIDLIIVWRENTSLIIYINIDTRNYKLGIKIVRSQIFRRADRQNIIFEPFRTI